MQNFQTEALDLSQKVSSIHKMSAPEILCPQNHMAKFACFKDICDRTPFICQSSECQCRKLHKACFHVELSSVVNGLEGCKVPTHDFQQMVYDRFQKIIDKICDFRDGFIEDVKRSFQYHGLDPEGIFILKAFSESKTQQITSQQIWKACFKSEMRDKAVLQLKTVIGEVQRHLNEFQSSISAFCSKIHNEIISFYVPEVEENQKNSDENEVEENQKNSDENLEQQKIQANNQIGNVKEHQGKPMKRKSRMRKRF